MSEKKEKKPGKVVGFFQATLLGMASILATTIVWIFIRFLLNEGFAALAGCLMAVFTLSIVGGYVGFQWKLTHRVNTLGVWFGFELPQYGYAVITGQGYNFIRGFLMIAICGIFVFVGHYVAKMQRGIPTIGLR